MHLNLSGVLDQLGGLPDGLMAAAIGLVMMLDAVPLVGIAVPADVALLVAVGSRGPAGAALAVAGVLAGTLTAWSLSYLVGRRLGGRMRRGRLGRWVGAHRWDLAERVVRGGGAEDAGGGRFRPAASAVMLALVPFLPMVNTVVPMVAGGLGVPYRRFLRYAAIGTTVWATIYAVIGLTARTASVALLGSGSPLGLVVFGVPGLAISWVIVLAVRRQLTLAPAVPAPAGAEPRQAGRAGRAGRRAGDRVLDGVGVASADRAGQPGVGLIDLRAERGPVPVGPGPRRRRTRRQLIRHVRAGDRPGSGVPTVVLATGRSAAGVRRRPRGGGRG